MNINNMPEDDLDDLFRKSASAYEPEFDEAAWEAMEKKLDAHQYEKSYWRRIGFSSIFFFLIGISTWFGFTRSGKSAQEKNDVPALKTINANKVNPDSSPELNDKQSTGLAKTRSGEKVAAIPFAAKIEPSNQSPRKPISNAKNSKPDANESIKIQAAGSQNKRVVLLGAKEDKLKSKDNGVVIGKKQNRAGIAENTLASQIIKSEPENKAAGEVTNKEGEKIVDIPASGNKEATPKTETVAGNNAASADKEKLVLPLDSTRVAVKNFTPDTSAPPRNRPAFALNRFALTVMAAPDLSTVGLSNPGGISTNAGVAVSYFITEKWRVSAGLVKARKIYTARPHDYKSKPAFWNSHYKMEGIEAECQVLDIPVTIGYRFWQKNKSALTVNTGLSSYLMRSERYEYEYYYYGKEYYKTWEVTNQNQHLLSVYNLSVGYARQVSKSLSLGAEPFVKVPLAGVGAGKVKLASAGVFFSLSFRYP